jgi:hypothetical protein
MRLGELGGKRAGRSNPADTRTLQGSESKRRFGFFITGRSEIAREATEANLIKAGYDGWGALIMRPARTSTPSAADHKAPERVKIAAPGYTIIANVGDQPSDLSGGNAERTYLVPNPFYRIP